jgi:hypothetical protein
VSRYRTAAVEDGFLVPVKRGKWKPEGGGTADTFRVNAELLDALEDGGG